MCLHSSIGTIQFYWGSLWAVIGRKHAVHFIYFYMKHRFCDEPFVHLYLWIIHWTGRFRIRTNQTQLEPTLQSDRVFIPHDHSSRIQMPWALIDMDMMSLIGSLPKCWHAKIWASLQILTLIWLKAKKAAHLAKCYSKLAKVLAKNNWHADILACWNFGIQPSRPDILILEENNSVWGAIQLSERKWLLFKVTWGLIWMMY